MPPPWVWPAAGAAFGAATSLFGDDNQKQEVEVDDYTRGIQRRLMHESFSTSPAAWGYGPHRVFAGPSPATEQLAAAGIRRAGTPAPYERAAGDYASRAVQGGYLGANPAMGYLGAYGAGAGGMPLWGGPGRAMMMGTAAGGGYSNPYLDSMVNRAMGRVGAAVDTRFGRSSMGGGSAHQQLMARELGGIASDMYGRAYESERGRQTAMQQALGGLETGRLGLGVQQRGQNIGAATTLGQLYGQERGLQQEAAFNVPALAASDLARIQAGLGIARGVEGYGERQRGEEVGAWQQDQLAPFRRLQGIAGIASGFPSGTTTTVERPGINPLTAALGGGLAGYGLYRMGGFGGAGGGSAPYRTGSPAYAPGAAYSPWGPVGAYTPGVPS